MSLEVDAQREHDVVAPAAPVRDLLVWLVDLALFGNLRVQGEDVVQLVLEGGFLQEVSAEVGELWLKLAFILLLQLYGVEHF